MDISTLNDAARLNREILPTDDLSASVIPQYVFTGAVVNSAVRGVGEECPAGQQWYQPQCIQAPCPGYCAGPPQLPTSGPGSGVLPGQTQPTKGNSMTILDAISTNEAPTADYVAWLNSQPASQRASLVQTYGTPEQYAEMRRRAGFSDAPMQAGIMGMSPAFITLGAIGLAWFFLNRKKRR